ncbi:transcription factor GTE12-like isoform X1 [Miscanthus floridulus]|uniref:transcription factor GTE12-like isoform X1 n=1 Tax=Miscanthus floridulus TaxID=154761 RepID=UPI003457F2B3
MVSPLVRLSSRGNAKISRTRETERSSGSIGKESWSCNDTSTSPLASSLQGEEGYLHDEPLSPGRALRAAMLRSRFAGTIVKAQQKALLDHGKNIDPVKLQLEKERLEKRQQEEKARIEAQVKAAEAAAQRKFEEELRMKREQEREAARLALRMVVPACSFLTSKFICLMGMQGINLLLCMLSYPTYCRLCYGACYLILHIVVSVFRD